MSSGRDSLISSLGGEARDLVDQALDFERRYEIDLFLVGGAVRDLYLGEEVRDLDFVWIGGQDSSTISLAFGDFLGAEGVVREEFLTATFVTATGVRLDLGRARSEAYSAPAALPVVHPANLEIDLRRRDFSVNAIALPLKRPHQLLDPCDGVPDLDRRHLRTLHEHSFRDDPTRILRGLELATRRGLEFDCGTRTQADEAVAEGYLQLLSGARVRNELRRLFSRPALAAAAAESLKQFAIDRALHVDFRIGESSLERLRRVIPFECDPESFWIVALLALVWEAPRATRSELAERLSLSRGEREWLVQTPESLDRLVTSSSAVESETEAMLQLYVQLSGDQARLAGLLAQGPQAERLNEVRRRARLELEIRGGDLLGAGAASGPRIGEALEATLIARRAGRIDADQELEFAIQWLDHEDHDDGEL